MPSNQLSMQPLVLVVSRTSARFLAEERMLCSSCSCQSQRSRAFRCCHQGPVGSISSISPKEPHLELPHTLCPLAPEPYFSSAQHSSFSPWLSHGSACPPSWVWLYFLDGAGMCVAGSWSPALPPGWTWGPQHSLVSSPVSGQTLDVISLPCQILLMNPVPNLQIYLLSLCPVGCYPIREGWPALGSPWLLAWPLLWCSADHHGSSWVIRVSKCKELDLLLCDFYLPSTCAEAIKYQSSSLSIKRLIFVMLDDIELDWLICTFPTLREEYGLNSQAQALPHWHVMSCDTRLKPAEGIAEGISKAGKVLWQLFQMQNFSLKSPGKTVKPLSQAEKGREASKLPSLVQQHLEKPC